MIKPQWNNLIRIKLVGGPLNGEIREVVAHVAVFEAVVDNTEADTEPKAFAAGSIKMIQYHRTNRIEGGAVVFKCE